MKSRITHKLAVIAVLSTLFFLPCLPARSQGWDTPPEVKAQMRELGRLRTQGEDLIRRGRTEEGLAKLYDAKRLERTIPGYFLNTATYALAKALAALGRSSEALEVFKDVLRWDPLKGDLVTDGGYQGGRPMMTDYAVLLAQQGRIDDAKAVYYAALRAFNVGWEDAADEPIPFLVVFDPDPTMTVWEATAEKIVIASTMLRATAGNGPDWLKFAERAKELDSAWVLPPLYLARNSRLNREENLALARNLARTDEEREWVRAFDIRATRQSIGVQRRAASTVLQEAKRQLTTTHTRIASGRINPG